ncbi:mandelate racemase/muconate lactonizing enzyme family protein [uncultured Litoreibacter sp.]|uniref:mandelate racemase/muconate lactonizing enzyme family protein n=1 Tax=uncultured Litoreibacter sp. TaxID=1392394 RepID=UPI0026105769|nr:mandelate racemase/muconate lactonizing enzyme family protein [uncultured Litoreibacter sp.]
MPDVVASVEVFTLTQTRETPYLGERLPGEEVNAKGYLVRKDNRTVYPTFDRSVLVRIETRQGVIGWGETYGIVAPGAVAAIINDLLVDFTIGRDPTDPSAIYDDLYDLMRVRGYTGGFYVDALAAIDIALWDIAGKQASKPVAEMLGGVVQGQIPAYVSGLPEVTLDARCALAVSWQAKGYSDFKFASPMANQGVEAELRALRAALGSDARIAADLHWNHTADEAISLITAMEPHGLWFAEAPVRTEGIGALEQVSKSVETPVAVGEEWRTDHDMRQRVERCRIAIVQPEMGHKGITNFMRIGKMAAAHGIDVLPHATIGAGIFLAASLQASSALEAVIGHEFQHSIFEPNRWLLTGDMDCAAGAYSPPTGPGLGVEPTRKALDLLQPI